MQKQDKRIKIKSTKRKVSHQLDIGLGVCKKCLNLVPVDLTKIVCLDFKSKEEVVAAIQTEKEFCKECRPCSPDKKQNKTKSKS